MAKKTTTIARDLTPGMRITLVINMYNTNKRIPCLVIDIFANSVYVVMRPDYDINGRLVPGNYAASWFKLSNDHIAAEYEEPTPENAATEA